MNDNAHTPTRAAAAHRPWRDPLSIGWQAHRRLLLMRLHWHNSAARGRAARLVSAAQHPKR